MKLLSDREHERYSRQLLLDRIGEEGQAKLGSAKVVLVGCGATGSALAGMLVRAGVGYLRIIDRDFVELNNLQRQTIFNEDDIETPKALAAVERLRLINSDIELSAEVTDFNATNAEDLVTGMDLILDGTDNMATRFLINDIAVKLCIPWIYSGAVGTYGMTMTILTEDDTPCFRCFLPNPPKPGSLDTCDTSGVLNTIPQLITSITATEAIKILMGKDLKGGRLLIADVWDPDFKIVEVAKRSDCITCVKNDYEYLKPEQCTTCITLCGRDAVQVRPEGLSGEINFQQVKERLEPSGEVKVTDHTLIFKAENIKITLFKDGRTIIQGVDNENDALNAYSKYVGL